MEKPPSTKRGGAAPRIPCRDLAHARAVAVVRNHDGPEAVKRLHLGLKGPRRGIQTRDHQDRRCGHEPTHIFCFLAGSLTRNAIA
jgi:hypothetical protein